MIDDGIDVTVMAAAFDTLDGEVAVLDACGTILAVNAGWKRFAAASGGAEIGVGADYFAACASSSDPLAAAVLRELRAIAARCPSTDPVLITVRHESLGDIERDLATRLERSRRRMLTITDRMGDGLCTLDDRGRITYVNPVGECLLQASGARALGGSFVNRLVGTHPDGTVRTREEVLIGAEFDGVVPMTTTEDLLVRMDGSRLPIEYLLTPLPAESLGQPDGWMVVFRDISERKERERRLAVRTEHATWMQRIQEALDEHRFVLHAQPIVDLATMRTVQHELLLRLEDPEEGLIGPGRFLPTAEAYGLAPSIDRWVIGQALEIAACGQPVELNLSAKSLTDPSLPYFIEGELKRTRADPASVVFEITETALIENDAAVRNLAERLRGFGCKLALALRDRLQRIQLPQVPTGRCAQDRHAVRPRRGREPGQPACHPGRGQPRARVRAAHRGRGRGGSRYARTVEGVRGRRGAGLRPRPSDPPGGAVRPNGQSRPRRARLSRVLLSPARPGRRDG